EIGHGLNFQGFYNLATGAVPSNTQPTWGDIYSNNVFDDATSKTWVSMTPAERVTAATADKLVWTGATVTAQVPAALGPLIELNVTGNLTATYEYGTASFGPTATTGNFTGAAVVVDDGSANPTQGCNALTNGAAVTGNIAVVDRGTCAFTVKAKNAQLAGATGVIVVNNAAGPAPGLGGADPTVTIPAVSLSQADGTALKAALPGSSVGLAVQPGFAGSDATGRARLYAPATLAQGSTFSHYDARMFPNALQEPAINQDLDGNFRVDLNPALYQDIGWVLNTGNAKTRNGACDTGVKVLVNPGLIGGANLQAADKLCRRSNVGNSLGYRSCVNGFVNRLATAGLIPNALDPAIKACTIR
ncbi:MAG: PA domain-containing protein, partial [Luteimonas sp.]